MSSEDATVKFTLLLCRHVEHFKNQNKLIARFRSCRNVNLDAGFNSTHALPGMQDYSGTLCTPIFLSMCTSTMILDRTLSLENPLSFLFIP